MDLKKKMIYVGSLAKQPDRDSNWIRAFSDLGWTVVSFCSSPQLGTNFFLSKLQRRFHVGRPYRLMRKRLLELCHDERPLWVHFRLPVEFNRSTIRELKKLGIFVTEYFNDNPFSKLRPFGIDYKFKGALSEYDTHFVYRRSNVRKFLERGATEVHHCKPTYDPSRHYPVTKLRKQGFIADAAFIGHCERDNRVAGLSKLKESGFSVVVRGGMWDSIVRGTSLEEHVPISHAFGEEYNFLYGNVLAGVCFFSKVNQDSFTERPLEIIAVGGVLVCERTEEAQSYFKEGHEALFFSSARELCEQVGLLKKNPDLRARIRDAGRARLLESKFTVNDRAQEINDAVIEHLL